MRRDWSYGSASLQSCPCVTGEPRGGRSIGRYVAVAATVAVPRESEHGTCEQSRGDADDSAVTLRESESGRQFWCRESRTITNGRALSVVQINATKGQKRLQRRPMVNGGGAGIEAVDVKIERDSAEIELFRQHDEQEDEKSS